MSAPILALAAAAAAALVVAVLRRPDFAVHAVLFLLYTNLPAVSVAFHGVPKVLAAAFPLLLMVPLARDLAVRRLPLVLTPVFALLVLMLAVQVAGAAFAVDPPSSLGFAGTFAVEGALLHLLVVNVVRDARGLRAATWSLVAAGLFLSVVPILQQVTGSFDSSWGGLGQVEDGGFLTGASQRQARLSGTIGETNRFAQVMLVLLPLALALWRSPRHTLLRLAAVACAVGIALGFALAFSRGGAVGLVCLAAAAVVLRRLDLRKALAAAGVLALVVVALPQYGQRLRSIGTSLDVLDAESGRSAADGAVRRRATSMLAATRVFADHAAIGVGPGMFKEHSQEYGNQDPLRRIEGGRRAHSLFLELAAEGGAIGLALFLGALAVALHGLALARRACAHADPELAELCGAWMLALVAYLSTGIFLHLSYMRYFHLLLALCSAAAQVGLRGNALRTPMRSPAAALQGGPA